MTQIMREFPRPRIEVEPTEFGFRIVTLRQISDAHTHVRVTNLVFPNAFIIPMSREMTITPVARADRRRASTTGTRSSRASAQPVNKDEMRRQRLELYELPDYVPRKNKSNDYGFDPHEQEHDTFTGMGADINVHDQWACESMGAIQDRTREHLGQSDKAISAYRRLLRQAIDEANRRRHAADGARRAGGAEASPAPPRSTASARPTTGRATGSTTDAEQAQGRELGEWPVSSSARRAPDVPPARDVTACPEQPCRRATSQPSSTATICGATSSAAPRRRSSARSSGTSSKWCASAFADQHGVLRGKTLVAVGCGRARCATASP